MVVMMSSSLGAACSNKAVDKDESLPFNHLIKDYNSVENGDGSRGYAEPDIPIGKGIESGVIPLNEPCYLDQDLESLTLKITPAIGELANYRSWKTHVVLGKDGAEFSLDSDSVKVVDDEGRERKRALIEQLLWVCDTEATEVPEGWPESTPELCEEVTVTTQSMSLNFSSEDQASRALMVSDVKPDGDSEKSGDPTVITITKQQLGWNEGDLPIKVSDLSQLDFKWQFSWSARRGVNMRNQYIRLSGAGENGESGFLVGHITAAFPHISKLTLKVNEYKTPLWEREVGGLYYDDPGKFFTSEKKKAEVEASDPKQSLGLYTPPKKLLTRANNSIPLYNYYEDSVTHQLTDSDITTDEAWYQKHKNHCVEVSRRRPSVEGAPVEQQ